MINTFDKTHYDIFSIRGFANIIIALTIFSLFLSIFYFTYASKVENQIVDIQIKNLVDNLTENMKDILSSDQRAYLLNVLKTTNPPDMKVEDDKIEKSNKQLIKQAAIVFGIFLALTTIVVTILYFMYNIDVKNILITNMIILLFVALTEVFFLNMIAKSYRSLDPNIVKKNLINQLQSFEFL